MSGVRRDGTDLAALLERAAKVSDQAEIFFVQHRDEPVMFEANRLKLVETKGELWSSLEDHKGRQDRSLFDVGPDRCRQSDSQRP